MRSEVVERAIAILSAKVIPAETAQEKPVERFAAAVLADNYAADVEQIKAIWRRLFDIDLERERARDHRVTARGLVKVADHLAMLKKWQERLGK